jgi:hypothetical protein
MMSHDLPGVVAGLVPASHFCLLPPTRKTWMRATGFDKRRHEGREPRETTDIQSKNTLQKVIATWLLITVQMP